MKKKAILISAVCVAVTASAAVGVFVFTRSEENKTNDLPDEGKSILTNSSSWNRTRDNTQHTVGEYSLGNTAERVKNDLSDEFEVSHKFVDEVPVYEMYRRDAKNAPIVIFLHGQFSEKEENLDEMTEYADAGYFCVALDLQGHGERISSEPLMALEITKNTADDLDLLLDYYEAAGLADADRFALVGFSQGGSVAYWYSVYGDRVPGALVVGSTSPDYSYSYDDKCICNGEVADPVWSEEETKAFVTQYNPIQHADKLMQMPIMSGNSINDDVVSYKGSESLEKILKKGGNTKIRFYYFDNAGHNVTTEFVSKVLPFIRQYM